VCSIAVIFTQKPTWVVVDSTAFDAKTYYEQLITTSSLPTLLKRENDLLAGKIHLPPHDDVSTWCIEIRQLDSERQSLVYNRHHELIAASDTIGAVGVFCPLTKLVRHHNKCTQMKTRADSLDTDLDHLREAFSEISRLGAEVQIEQPEGRGNEGTSRRRHSMRVASI